MARRSIRRDLTLWLSGLILLAVLGAAVGTYLRARDEANVLFDYQLKEMAASLIDAPFARSPLPGAGGTPGADALVVQIWDRNGVQLYLSQPRRDLPQNAQLGFTNARTEQGDWRIFSALAAGQVVQVAQPMSARRDLAASMALRTIAPLLLVLPLMVLLIGFSIARGLKPLSRVAEAVGRRSPESLEPLPEDGLPREVRPLVLALNGLLARLDRALDAQKSFIADAAHELRTPLTAVHLQAQLAERAAGDDERRSAMAELNSGLDRATRLVEQLLTLAREEPDLADRPAGRVDLGRLARGVVEDLAPLAAAKHIDLGLTGATEAGEPAPARPVETEGDADALLTLVTNLVDNAVRYTPAGGRVDVQVGWDGSAAFVAVADTGPGIPRGERERVFDRFYRGNSTSTQGSRGSGLGLAIVKRIASRHRAQIAVGQGLDGRGLTVRVRFLGNVPPERLIDYPEDRFP